MKMRCLLIAVVTCLISASAQAVEPQKLGQALPVKLGESDAVKRVAEHVAARSLTLSKTPKVSGDTASVEVQVADKSCSVELARLPTPKDNQVYSPDDLWKVTGLACK
ncbi:MAG: hypothetical protein HOP04_01995 [Methylophilaceae bacterium]|nr:hypothetical protein [Methylophilaceae bacterium]